MKKANGFLEVVCAVVLCVTLTSCGTNLTPTIPPAVPSSTATQFTTAVPSVTAIPTNLPTEVPLIAPKARGYHSMTYDSESKQIILFGGSTDNPMRENGRNNETWSYNPTTKIWAPMSPKVTPGGFSGSMTYDDKADRVILVLNTDPVTRNFFDYKSSQTWAYDFNTDAWTRLADGPSGRLGARVAYDSESDKVILFGGYSLRTNEIFNETWAYDFNTDTWTQMQPSLSPEGQNYQCMAYDSKADRVINWGGDGLSSLWTYDYNTDSWEKQKTEAAPSVPYYGACTYDDKADLFILYGGTETGYDQTWTYDLDSSTWQKMEPDQNPGRLSRHTLVYDPVTDQSILFGGQIGGIEFFYSGETWFYDINTNTWTKPIPAD